MLLQPEMIFCFFFVSVLRNCAKKQSKKKQKNKKKIPPGIIYGLGASGSEYLKYKKAANSMTKVIQFKQTEHSTNISKSNVIKHAITID